MINQKYIKLLLVSLLFAPMLAIAQSGYTTDGGTTVTVTTDNNGASVVPNLADDLGYLLGAFNAGSVQELLTTYGYTTIEDLLAATEQTIPAGTVITEDTPINVTITPADGSTPTGVVGNIIVPEATTGGGGNYTYADGVVSFVNDFNGNPVIEDITGDFEILVDAFGEGQVDIADVINGGYTQVDNGNGTITLTAPDGTTATVAYTSPDPDNSLKLSYIGGKVVLPLNADGVAVLPEFADDPTLVRLVLGSGGQNGSSRGLTITQTPAPGTAITGETLITITAKNFYGAVSTIRFYVSVEDTVAPSITCPADIEMTAGSNQNRTRVYWGTPTTTDNASEVNIQSDKKSGDYFNVGTTTVTYTATDASGNKATCSFDVTVVQPLDVWCNDDITVSLAGTGGPAYAYWNIPPVLTDIDCQYCKDKYIPGFTYVGTFEGHQYYYSNAASTWQLANLRAMQRKGYLVSINSQRENWFLRDRMNNEEVAIGLTSMNGVGSEAWTNGDEIDYTNYYTGEPYTQFFRQVWKMNTDGEWYAASSSEKLHYIVELPCYDVEQVKGKENNSSDFGYGATTIAYDYDTQCGHYNECEFDIKVTDKTTDYCTTGAASSEHVWIEEVKLFSMTNTSGNDGGYGSYIGKGSLVLQTGKPYNLTITPGYKNADHPIKLTTNVWIDANSDGDFYDAGEHIVQNHRKIGEVSLDVVFPTKTTIFSKNVGNRIRIDVRPTTYEYQYAPCGYFAEGEAEDYLVSLYNLYGKEATEAAITTSPISATTLTTFPNPANQIVNVDLTAFDGQAGVLTIQNAVGQTVARQSYTSIPAGITNLDVANLENGVYFLSLEVNGMLNNTRFVVQHNQ